jgi:glutamine amidotransferase
MGWNSVRPRESDGLFKSIEKDKRFYFLHSYYFECFDHGDVLATTDYGGDFSSAIRHGNIYGVQFHPEKSHSAGVRLLHNFAEL